MKKPSVTRKRTITRILGLSLLLLCNLGWAEEYPAWSRHAEILVNTSATGANVSGQVTGFPLLVRLNASVFAFSEAQGKGADIRFTSAAGKVLPFEIERWDSAGAAAEIWVKADTLKGNTAGQVLKMHWGNAAAASASNGSAVFSDASGFVAVWHLGGTGSRANSVAGGNAAVPVNYRPDASQPGIIGMADSMAGGSPGGYLDIGDGYGMFTSGFTYSVWVNPVMTANSVHFLDLGNGGGVDNIAVARYQATQNIGFLNVDGTASSNLIFGEAGVAPGQWQNIAVTVSGNLASIYRNGALINSEILTQPINGTPRTSNYLGRSNWSSQDYFKGEMDEPRLAKIAQSPNWIKLGYENQRPDQQVISFRKQAACASSFSASADSTVTEGGILELSGVAECADSYVWTTLEGPTPRILDPEVKSLRILVPRVTRDTVMKYLFSATFGDTVRTRQVNVYIKESIPDPLFTLPAYLEWDGKSNLVIQPSIANLNAVIASASPSIQYTWNLPGQAVDTSMLDGALMLKPQPKESDVKINLCLDNGGSANCHQVQVVVLGPTVSLVRPAARSTTAALRPRFDLTGRKQPASQARISKIRFVERL